MTTFTHEQIEQAIDGAFFHEQIVRRTGYGKVRLEITLGEDDSLTECYTRPDGRVHDGPAVMEIDAWDDGSVNVGYTVRSR